jgi:hypothetical protein
MFRIRSLALGLVVFLLVGPAVSAASNVWAHGFPKTLRSGGIAIQGTATADAGFTLGKTGTAIVWPAGRKGGVVTSFTVTVDPATGVWSGTLTGLRPEVHYEIVVQVTQTMGSTTQTIATEPKRRENEK